MEWVVFLVIGVALLIASIVMAIENHKMVKAMNAMDRAMMEQLFEHWRNQDRKNPPSD